MVNAVNFFNYLFMFFFFKIGSQLKFLYSMKIKEQTRKLAAGCTWVRQGDVDAVWIWFSKSISLV